MNKKMNFLDFEDAVQKSLDFIIPSNFTEIISIFNAVGRVLSKDVICVKNQKHGILIILEIVLI